MALEDFGYSGRRVLVVGGASGMGAAVTRLCADLGARTVVLDVAPVEHECDQSIQVDLRDRSSVDAALAEVSGPIHTVFACAGVADGTPGLMLVNFTAQRHLIEGLIGDGALGRGGSIVMISSVAGLGWLSNLEVLRDFVSTPGWDAAAAWVDAHEGTDSYGFSKQAINFYVAHESFPMLRKGIRINAVLPGPTDTPLARANADLWLGFAADYREAAGVETLQPEEIASVMAFLGSDAAGAVNGVSLLVDQGHVAASLSGSFDAPLVKMLAGIDDA